MLAGDSIFEMGGIFKVVVCYARKDNESANPDEQWLERVMEHLNQLADGKMQIEPWSDEELQGGDSWDIEIRESMNTANAAVFLVSPAFLCSEYIRQVEAPILLERMKQENIKIIPMILRPCLPDKNQYKFPDHTTGPHKIALSSLQTPYGGLSG